MAPSSLIFYVSGTSVPRLQADKVFSEAHDDLYQFGFESHRWFPMALRKPKQAKVGAAAPDHGAAGASTAAADSTDAAISTTVPQGKVCQAPTH